MTWLAKRKSKKILTQMDPTLNAMDYLAATPIQINTKHSSQLFNLLLECLKLLASEHDRLARNKKGEVLFFP